MTHHAIDVNHTCKPSGAAPPTPLGVTVRTPLEQAMRYPSVQQCAKKFFEWAEAATGTDMSRFVKNEFATVIQR